MYQTKLNKQLTLTKRKAPDTEEEVAVQTEIKPTAFVDPIFPNLEDYAFFLKPQGRLPNSVIEIVTVGHARPASSRKWNLSLGTPSCMIENLRSGEQGTTLNRFLLKPDYFNEHMGSDFNTLLDHIEGVSEKLMLLMKEEGFSTDDWVSPVRTNQGIVEGLQVKVRSAITKEKAENAIGPVRCVIKLNCIYVAPQRSGTSWELVDVSSLF